MRLAVVSPFVDRRHGTERAVAELLQRLAQHPDCEIHLYARSVEDLPVEAAAHPRSGRSGIIYWHRVPAVPGPHIVQFLCWMALNGWQRRWDCWRRWQQYDLVLSPGINCLHPDVVIVHALFHRLRQLASEEGEERTGFLRRLHRRVYYGLLVWLEREIYTRPNVKLAAVSKRTADLLKETVGRADVTVVPNGVDTEQFSPQKRLALRAEARRSRDISESEFVLLLIGNDWRTKGLLTVLQAMGRLRELALKLIVVGNDAALDFRDEAMAAGLQERCRWEAPQPKVLDFYAAADAYVSPSREDSFGLPVAEAMACGLPVITSRYAGVAEYVRNGVDGMVMEEPGDAEELARLIVGLQSDVERRGRIGEEASATASGLNWERQATAIWQILTDCGEKKRESRIANE